MTQKDEQNIENTYGNNVTTTIRSFGKIYFCMRQKEIVSGKKTKIKMTRDIILNIRLHVIIQL